MMDLRSSNEEEKQDKPEQVRKPQSNAAIKFNIDGLIGNNRDGGDEAGNKRKRRASMCSATDESNDSAKVSEEDDTQEQSKFNTSARNNHEAEDEMDANDDKDLKTLNAHSQAHNNKTLSHALNVSSFLQQQQPGVVPSSAGNPFVAAAAAAAAAAGFPPLSPFMQNASALGKFFGKFLCVISRCFLTRHKIASGRCSN